MRFCQCAYQLPTLCAVLTRVRCYQAGSEILRKTGVEGHVLREAQHINKSLSALNKVVKPPT
eukprot:3479339-Rhodomonas_salina.2